MLVTFSYILVIFFRRDSANSIVSNIVSGGLTILGQITKNVGILAELTEVIRFFNSSTPLAKPALVLNVNSSIYLVRESILSRYSIILFCFSSIFRNILFDSKLV